MKLLFAGISLAVFASASLSAQSTDEPAADAAQAASPADAATQPVEYVPAPVRQDLTLGLGTPIKLAVAEEVNSSTHREGDLFKLTVLEDVKAGNTVVIPRGTPATAEITWRTGKGAFGKSGKLEFALQSIDLNGVKIPITGEFRQEGEGNTIATGVGVLAVGLFAGFITGKRARLPQGRELLSQLAQPVPFTADGRLAASFDSDAAMATAAANTEIGRCKLEAAKETTERKREKATEECYSKRME
jgi:hypothetical protein